MRMLHFDIDCPKCHTRIHVPFVEELKDKAVEDFNIAELSAQDKLLSLELCLQEASLITLLKYWLRNKRGG